MAISDYEKQMSALQNAAYGYGNQGLGSIGNQYNYRRHPFEGYDLGSMSTSEIQDMIIHLQQIYDRKTLHTPLWAPTRAQCNEFESLANAHKELCVIKKLVGL